MDTPSIVKVLRYLKGVQSPVSLNDIIMATEGSQTLVLRALDTLARDGIINSENNTFSYVSSTRADDLSEKLFQLFPTVTKESEIELTLLGVICHLGNPRAYLRVGRIMEIMARDGHRENDTYQLLMKEKNAGYVESLWINFKSREPGTAIGIAYGKETNGKIRTISLSMVPCPPPLIIPIYYFAYFFDVSPEKLKNIRDAVIGREGNPEEYITGNYPAEVTDAAMKHFLGRKTAMSKAIKDEATREWEALKRTGSLMDFTYGLSG
jgi:hypothetical protein